MPLTQLDVARAGDRGGLGAAGQLSAEAVDVGRFGFGYAVRPGLPDLATARVSAPHRAVVQAALWSAAELDGADPRALALAAELRVQLPRRLFVRGEAARLYHTPDPAGGLRPLMSVLVFVGTVLGEPVPGAG